MVKRTYSKTIKTDNFKKVNKMIDSMIIMAIASVPAMASKK